MIWRSRWRTRGCVLALLSFLILATRLSGADGEVDGALADGVAEYSTGDDVDSGLDEILSSPEYRHIVSEGRGGPERETASWWNRFWEWLFGQIEDRPEEAESSSQIFSLPLLRETLYFLAFVILVLVLVFVIRAFVESSALSNPDRRVKPEPGELGIDPHRPPGEMPALEYLALARDLAARGLFQEAIAQILLASMSWIERAKLIRHRKGLTNRDYLRSVRRRPLERSGLETIVRHFEEVYFGRRAASAERYRSCLEGFESGFPGETEEPAS